MQQARRQSYSARRSCAASYEAAAAAARASRCQCAGAGCLQLLRGIESQLRSQLCRAVCLLLVDVADGPGSLLLREAASANLPIDTTLELLTLVPDGGAWLQEAEVATIQLFLLELLDHACDPAGVKFPAALPASGAPTASSSAYRTAVLECACAWAQLPCEEGITLSVLSEAPSFRSLLSPMQDATPKERRLSYELLSAALEHEPTEDAHRSGGISPGARHGSSSMKRPVGTRLPFVPRQILLVLLDGLTLAQPLAASAARPIDESSGGVSKVYLDDDEEDDEEDEGVLAQLGLVTFGGVLIRKTSASLTPDACVPPAHMPPPVLEGDPMSAPVSDGQLQAALLSLLQMLVPCTGHRRRAVCETLLATDFLQPALRAADHWGLGAMLALQAGLPSTATTNGEMRDLLLSSLTSALRERAAFPSESSLEGWDANELEEYCGFRDAHLQEAFAEIARHEPSVPLHIAIELYQEGSNAKTTPAGAPPPPHPLSWQSKEAALFGMISTSEVLLSRILPLPSSSSSYQTPPPPPLECSPLESALITLLQLVLHTSPTALGGGGSSYSDTLLLRGRCQLVGALAPWLAGSGQPHLDAAVAGVLPCLTHAAAPTASAALICWNQLSMRCASELAASQERLMAALNLIATPTPALSEEQRQQLVESTTRFAIASPEGDGQRTRLLEGLLGPLMQSMTQPLTELERSAGSGGGGAQDAAVVSLRVRLNDLAAALRPLRAVGKDAYASFSLTSGPYGAARLLSLPSLPQPSYLHYARPGVRESLERAPHRHPSYSQQSTLSRPPSPPPPPKPHAYLTSRMRSSKSFRTPRRILGWRPPLDRSLIYSRASSCH